jgi:hypothetical protein
LGFLRSGLLRSGFLCSALVLTSGALFKADYLPSGASFCHQVAAQALDIFCNLYLVKNHKIANTLTTTKARENIAAHLISLEFEKFFIYV